MNKILMLAACLLALCAGPRAQVVRLSNAAPVPFSGWVRTTIDTPPPVALAGKVGDTLFVVGRRVGIDVHVVDLRVSLAAGERRSIDLTGAPDQQWTRPPLPADPLAWFGGVATIGGEMLRWVSLVPDGAGYTAHLRARTGPMLCTDLWVTWYPDQPAFARGEVVVTASNPAVPNMGATVPPGFTLRFGDSLVLLPGAGLGPLIAAGETLADGQARAMPITFIWMRHLTSASLWSSAGSLAELAVGSVGVRRLLADGNPTYPAGFSARTWAGARWGESVRRLHTFDGPVVGPAPFSGTTGAQEDQVFVRGEALLPDGAGAEVIAYLGALKMANRPCHLLEQDGRQLDPAAHPQLRLWDGRTHWSTNVSPDRLGKPSGLAMWEAHGWFGPDVEHWLVNTLAAACRLTGSPACQWLLGQHARTYLLQRTLEPGVSTSTEGSWTRAVGWEGILVVHLWRELEDRALAQRVVDRWRARCTTLILPRLAAAPGDIWDVRTDTSASVPIVPGWMPWQQALAAYGLDLVCRVVGPAEGRAIALRGAKRVVADTWVREGARWVDYERLSLAGDRSRSGFYVTSWLPCAPAVVLRAEPQHEKARAVWAQIVADSGGDGRWLPPGVQ